MSMLKTLQSNPGTITIFHRQSSLSKALLQELQQQSTRPNQSTPAKKSLWSKILSGFSNESQKDSTRYLIDEQRAPTFDQLKLIRSYIYTPGTNNHSSKVDNLNIFKQAFPNFADLTGLKDSNGKGFIDETEFSELTRNGGDASAWFHDPLIVDWEKGLLANNKESLDGILDKHVD